MPYAKLLLIEIAFVFCLYLINMALLDESDVVVTFAIWRLRGLDLEQASVAVYGFDAKTFLMSLCFKWDEDYVAPTID